MLTVAMTLSMVMAQTPSNPQKPPQEVAPEDIVRITTSLVQTDVVVTDKNDQIIPDLKLEDFELSDNGKKQDVKFMEFVSVDTGRRSEGTRPSSIPNYVEQTGPGLSVKDLKRVIAFVIDDLTIPIQDIVTVRKLLLDFVDNKMRDGDLVAIVRVVGGKGLLQQFTSDRQLLRRAINLITPSTHALMSFGNPDLPRFSGVPQPVGGSGDTSLTPAADAADLGTSDISSASDETNRFFRGISTLATANFVIDSLKEIPGHKNLVIVSGGIPVFEANAAGTAFSNVSSMLNQMSDNAIRAGVVVNTLDPRGLVASRPVAGFQDTPGRGGLDPVQDAGFGRGGDQSKQIMGDLLVGASEHLGLSTIATATGGVSVVNANNFGAGMEKILARSQGYYLLAYTPSEKFDRKWHKIEVRIRRSGAKVYSHAGYVAREEQPAAAAQTKEEEIAFAAKSPLAKRDIDVTPNVTMKLLPTNKAAIDVHMLIDARNLHFSHSSSGKYQTSLDVVCFLFDQFGRRKGGISDTINLDLTSESYQRALAEGLVYSASTELSPGYYQVRSVVREAGSGSLGTFSKYVEIPDLTKGRIAMSSVFLFAVDSAPGSKPSPLLASRQLTQKQELRFAAMIYNSKLKDGTPQLHSQVFITQGSRVLYSEPDQVIVSPSASPVVKLGQVGLSRVPPGRYLLTVVITDPLADKNNQTQARSINFTVVH